MKCKFCGYEWKSRVSKPKRCPYCQTWINKPARKEKKTK